MSIVKKILISIELKSKVIEKLKVILEEFFFGAIFFNIYSYSLTNIYPFPLTVFKKEIFVFVVIFS